MGVTKNISGSFINNCVVPTYDLPGNFGVRVIINKKLDNKESEEQKQLQSDTQRAPVIKPKFQELRNNMEFGFVCDQSNFGIPDLLENPNVNDLV